MATYYVATTGSNPAAGGLTTPWRDPQYGAIRLSPGDQLLLRGGTYASGITTINSGTSWSSPVRIAAYPGESVWLVPTSIQNVITLQSGEHHIEIDGINLDGRSADWQCLTISANPGNDTRYIRYQNAEMIARTTDNSAVSAWGSHVIELACKIAGSTGGHELINLTLHGGGRPGSTNYDNGYGIYCAIRGCLIEYCNIYDNKGVGIAIYNDDSAPDYPDNCIVRYNRIHDQTRAGAPGQNQGILVTTNNNQVYGNLLYRMTAGTSGGEGGITIIGVGNKIWNNTIYDYYSGIYLYDARAVNTEIRNNICYLNTAGNYVNFGGTGTVQDHNLFGTDPGFTNATLGDFTITSASPAYHTGVAVGIPTDYQRTAYSAPPSIGALEVDEAIVGTGLIIGNNTGNDFAGWEDVYIKSDAPTLNHDADPVLKIEKYYVGAHRSSLIRATGLSSLPASGTATGAVLSLYLEISNGPAVLTAYRLLRDWTELGATWDRYDGINTWTTAGGIGSATDRAAVASGSMSVPNLPGAWYHLTGTQFVADVQGFIDGTYPNYGWILERTDSQDDTTFHNFSASEAVDGQRPYLTVTLADQILVTLVDSQFADHDFSTTTLTVTLTGIQAGDCITVGGLCNDVADFGTMSWADNKGNTYATPVTASSSGIAAISATYALNVAVGTTIITMTTTGADWRAVFAQAWRGVKAVSAFDDSDTGFGTSGTSMSTAALTVTEPGLIVAYSHVQSADPITPAVGWTLLEDTAFYVAGAAIYQTTTPGSATPSWSIADASPNWAAAAFALKAEAAAVMGGAQYYYAMAGG